MVMDEDVGKTNDVERTQRTEVVYPTKTSASDMAIISQVPPLNLSSSHQGKTVI